jgi:hypothetical protein
MVVKGLFLQKTNSLALIESLDQGGAYGYNITDRHGRSRAQSTRTYLKTIACPTARSTLAECGD